MISLHIGGRKVSWSEAEKLFAEVAPTQPIEFCDERGHVVATSIPGSEPVDWYHEPPPKGPAHPPTDSGRPLDEWRRLMGWGERFPDDEE
jgi:hypothetical protein